MTPPFLISLKENTFEKMSTTVQEDDKELDEFGVSESIIYES